MDRTPIKIPGKRKPTTRKIEKGASSTNTQVISPISSQTVNEWLIWSTGQASRSTPQINTLEQDTRAPSTKFFGIQVHKEAISEKYQVKAQDVAPREAADRAAGEGLLLCNEP